MTTRKVRSENNRARDIRKRLAENRARLESDLAMLGERMGAKLHPLGILRRHPLAVTAAGALLGVLLVRRPDLLVRSAGRLLAWGAPLALTSLARRVSR